MTMKKLLSIFLLVASLQTFGQAPDINYPNPYTIIPRKLVLQRLYPLTDARGYSFLVRDTLGNIWNVWLPTIKASYWSGKQDSTTLSNDTLYDWRAGIAYFRAVIALPSGSGIPGGSTGYAQYYLNSTTFGGSSAATMDATHIWVPTLYGSSSSAGSLTLSSTSHATKGLIYLGADQVSQYDETNHLLTINRSGNATVANNGLLLTNTTASTSGSSVQNSPAQQFHASAYGTTAGTSQAVDFQMYVQGTTSSVAAGQLNIASSTNGSAFANQLTLDNSGNVTVNGNLILGSGSTFIKAGANFVMSAGGSNRTVYIPAAGTFAGNWIGHNSAVVWNEGSYLFTDSIANQLAANASAIAEFKSSKKPLLIPRWTNAQRTGYANVIKGAVAVDTTKNKLIYGNGSSYSSIPREDTANTWTGSQDFTGATITVPTKTQGDNSTNASSTAYVDAAVAAVNNTKFSETADGTVSNTTATTSIYGTGTGSQTLGANSLAVGKCVVVKGSGYISTDASVPTLTITFANTSSNAGNAVGGLLTASMNNVPIEWEYSGTVRTTGSGGTIQLNGWISINGTKAYIATSTPFAFNTTVSQTFDVTAAWGTASVNNIIVTKQAFVVIQ